MMIVFRTHYLIDLIAGLFIVLPISHVADKLSFYFDVKLLGLRKAERKKQILLYQVCSRCGWSNPKASNLIDAQELAIHKRALKAKRK